MKKLILAIAIGLIAAIGFVHLFPAHALKMEFARQRLLSGAELKHKTVDGEVWPYFESGQGDLIVLVHGYTGSKENWLPIMRELSEHHRVIAVDLPGWGDSEPVGGKDYGPEAQAVRLSAFLKSEPPAALLVGHSMGGMIVGMSALAHPEQVQRLVFMSAAGVLPPTENEFTRLSLQGKSPFAIYEADAYIDFMKHYVFTDMQYIPKPMLASIVKKRALHKDFEKTVFTQMLQFSQAYTLQRRLPDIRQPAGLLWCDGDKIVDPSSAQVYAQGLKDSNAELLKGCGHMPMMEQPKQTVGFLLKQVQ